MRLFNHRVQQFTSLFDATSGITFLKKMMRERPTPAAICSTLTEKGAQTTMDALAVGAFAIVTKPKLGLKQFLHDSCDDVISAVKAAAGANVGQLALRSTSVAASHPKTAADTILSAGESNAMLQTTERIVARRYAGAGASAGGTVGDGAGDPDPGLDPGLGFPCSATNFRQL